jgi:hypothetical protein
MPARPPSVCPARNPPPAPRSPWMRAICFRAITGPGSSPARTQRARSQPRPSAPRSADDLKGGRAPGWSHRPSPSWEIAPYKSLVPPPFRDQPGLPPESPDSRRDHQAHDRTLASSTRLNTRAHQYCRRKCYVGGSGNMSPRSGYAALAYDPGASRDYKNRLLANLSLA